MGLFDKLRGKKKEPAPKQRPEEKQEMQDMVMTLYAYRKNLDILPDLLRELFADVLDKLLFTDENEMTLIFKDGTQLLVNEMTDPKETGAQAQGMRNFFARAPLENEAVKEKALLQISLFNCVIGFRFETDDNQQRTNYIMNTIGMIAEQLQAFILFPNMYLYHHNGKLLISIDGKTEFEEFNPIASSEILDRDVPESPADIARREHSFEILKEKGIPYIAHLKAAVLEGDAALKDKDAILKRLTAIFAACVQAEVFGSGEYQDPVNKAKEQIQMLDEMYQVRSNFTPQERLYIEQPKADPNAHVKYSWRYEGCAVLLWALSLLELGEPDQICDVPAMAKLLWNEDYASLSEKASLRSRAEILDAYDLILRYHWACVDARINKKEAPGGLDGGVVYERHYAFNWLLEADGITEWDEIQPNT